jgi:hypothetical protein
MLLYLKMRVLLDLRAVSPDEYSGSYLAAALAVGALLGLVAQQAWAWIGRRVISGLHGETRAQELRLVWGTSAAPQALHLLVLLPLDLLIAGPAAFTSESLDTVAAAWVAISIAVGLSLAVWSAFLFLRGIEVAAELPVSRALAGSVVALVLFVVVVGTPVVLGSLGGGGA